MGATEHAIMPWSAMPFTTFRSQYTGLERLRRTYMLDRLNIAYYEHAAARPTASRGAACSA
jgi:hypothetical protein